MFTFPRKLLALTLKHMRFGIRQRVALILLGGLLISLTLGGWLALREQSAHIDQEINRHGTQLAQILSHATANAVVGYDYHAIQVFLDETIMRADIGSVIVYSHKGNIMAQAQHADIDVTSLRIFKEPIVVNNKTVGEIHVGVYTGTIVALIVKQKEQLIARESATIIFLLLLEFIALSYLIVRPLAKISDALEHRDDHSKLPAAIELNSHDEFGDIARKFNQMRAQLQDAYRALQGKVELADQKLREANQHLLEKSTDLERVNEELQRQAVTDPLTGLPNRRKFQLLMNTQLRDAMPAKRQFAMLIVDVDFFKKINDSYGHDIGDLVLVEIANRLSQHVRKNDTVCRIGGEEFFILCCHTDASQARHIAEKLRQVIAEAPFLIINHRLSVTISVGFSATSDQDNDLQQQQDYPSLIYRQADLALYNSKMHGRNRVSSYADLPKIPIQGLEEKNT